MRTPKRLLGVKKAAHGRSPKQEKELAGRLGGKIVKGSGCGFDKGDVRVKNKILLEAKCTEKNSFSVTREMVRKIEDAACGCSGGEVPVMEIEFMAIPGQGKQKVVLMPEWALDMLIGE